jgi:hypothetical protein
VSVSTHVGAGLEVGGVDLADDVGAGRHEQLVAALLAAKILGGELVALDHRAHRAVADEHALGHRAEQREAAAAAVQIKERERRDGAHAWGRW